MEKTLKRLIVAADIHGWYPCWQELITLLEPGDGLVIAGDLFDNIYGERGNDNYWPEQIRLEWKELSFPKFYVYGNCDSESYFPEQPFEQILNLFGKRILIRHGHRSSALPGRANVVIQGHTHRSRLECREAVIWLNPGSLARPRDGEAAYAVMSDRGISIMRLRDHRPFWTIDF